MCYIVPVKFYRCVDVPIVVYFSCEHNQEGGQVCEIIIGRQTDAHVGNQVLNGIYALRYKVFYEKLGWDVDTNNGLEIDCFDQLNPVYMAAINDQKNVQGCWRLLPTQGPYMLRNTFPILLRGEDIPASEDIWELSRFAVVADENDRHLQVNMNRVSFEMIRRVYDFAVDNNIKKYVTVTSVALERLLKRIGIPIYRFGDKKSQKIGKVYSVACWVDVNEQFREAVYDGFYSRTTWMDAA